MSAAEEVVAEIFADVLEVPVSSTDVDFFDLGGHSLHAVRLATRLQDQFGVSIGVRDVFVNPSVGALARTVTEREAARDGAAAVADPRRAASSDPEAAIPATGAQRRHWRDYRARPDAPSHVIHVYELEQNIVPGRFEAACEALAARHDSLALTFRAPESGELLAQPTRPAIDFEWIAEAVDAPYGLDCVRDRVLQPFDLERGPMLRAGGVQLRGDRQLAYVAIPHIVGDHWSLGVLDADLAAFYADREARIRPAGSFVDFARWHAARRASGALADQAAFWRERLGGFDPDFGIKPRRPAWSERSFDADAVAMTLSPDDQSAIQRAAASHRVTLFTFLLAVCQVVLARRAESERAIVGSTMANRNRREEQDAVGLFANQVFFGSTVDRRLSFARFLADLQGATLDVHANSEIALDDVLDDLGVSARGNPWPFAAVLFQLVVDHDAESFLGVHARRLSIWNAKTKRDLRFNLIVRGDDLMIHLTYSSDLFDRAEAADLLQDYLDVARRASTDPSVSIAALSEPSSR